MQDVPHPKGSYPHETAKGFNEDIPPEAGAKSRKDGERSNVGKGRLIGVFCLSFELPRTLYSRVAARGFLKRGSPFIEGDRTRNFPPSC